MPDKLSLTVFLSHPIQYFSPLYRDIAAKADITVFYYSRDNVIREDKGFGHKVVWDIPLLDGYRYNFLKNFSASKSMNNRFFDAVNLGVFSVLRNTDSKIIMLNGWAYLSDWLVLLFAKLYNKKVWLRSEMPWNQEEMKKSSWQRRFKFFIFKRLVFKYFVDKFLFIGSQNKLYYQKHGIQSNRLIYAPYAVENKRLQAQRTDGKEARRKWGINNDNIVILFSGKLIEKKRPLDLLIAYKNSNVTNTTLFFMGDGPLRGDLESFIHEEKINNVIISGFINQSEIASVYAMSDIFVMCSGLGETWGLSVNEAMNFALPVIITQTCGSSFDLVEHGVNGYIIKEGDINDLTNKIKELVVDPDRRSKMGIASEKKIFLQSNEQTVVHLIETLRSE